MIKEVVISNNVFTSSNEDITAIAKAVDTGFEILLTLAEHIHTKNSALSFIDNTHEDLSPQ